MHTPIYLRMYARINLPLHAQNNVRVHAPINIPINKGKTTTFISGFTVLLTRAVRSLIEDVVLAYAITCIQIQTSSIQTHSAAAI